MMERRLITLPRFSIATIAGVLLLVGCASEQPSQRSASPDIGDSPHAEHTLLGPGSEALPAGTYALDLDARGSGEDHFPHVNLTVPDGWTNIDGWGVNSGGAGGGWMALTFWEVDEVFAHPCRWQRRMIQPGPTVAGLANVLATRPLRDATEPVDIEVDGFSGKQLEWSVPADMAGRAIDGGGFDFAGCDEDVSVGDHPFKSWTATAHFGGGERYHQGPGQVDRLWIIDVDGERLVVDAMHMPSADAEDRKELLRVMESIRFES